MEVGIKKMKELCKIFKEKEEYHNKCFRGD